MAGAAYKLSRQICAAASFKPVSHMNPIENNFVSKFGTFVLCVLFLLNLPSSELVGVKIREFQNWSGNSKSAEKVREL